MMSRLDQIKARVFSSALPSDQSGGLLSLEEERLLLDVAEAADYALSALSAEGYDGESKVRYAAWKKLGAAIAALEEPQA